MAGTDGKVIQGVEAEMMLFVCIRSWEVSDVAMSVAVSVKIDLLTFGGSMNPCVFDFLIFCPLRGIKVFFVFNYVF